jgi:putative exosortase-associated protein (TIGR04073 family)
MRCHPKNGLVLAGIALVLAGCTSAEQKLGRGINNVTEPFRLGEIQASYEEGRVFGGPGGGTVGFIHGVDRTIARTVVGAVEIVTFPIPSDPYMKPNRPVYPDSYQPRPLDTPTLDNNTAIGFGGNDAMPFIPGSRFHVFE